MTVDDYQLLGDACGEGNVTGVQRLLRWGPFADSGGTCAPASIPNRSVAWMRVERLSLSDRSPTLSTLVGLLGRTGTPLLLAVGAGPDEEPSVSIGFDPNRSAINWARAVASPAVRLTPTRQPVSLRHLADRNQGGLVVRLGLGTQPPDEPTVPLLESLLTIPEDRWSLLFTFQPSDDGSIDQTLAMLQYAEHLLAAHLTGQEQTTATASTTWTRSDVQRTMDWLDVLQLHGATARASGGWLLGAWVGAATHSALETVAASVSAATSMWGTDRSRWTLDRLGVADASGPPPTSFISNEEVTSLLQPPGASAPGLRMVESVVPGRRVPVSPRPLPIGTRLSSDDAVALDLKDLEGHAFIAGTTGSGKSTTTRRLAAELWNRHNVPFLILDPVKSDYSGLDASVDGGLHVICSRDLRLNVLEPWIGFDRSTHVDSIAALFKGAFSMPSPIPYVVDRLFRSFVSGTEWGAPITLHDLMDALDELVSSLGYSTEVESNIRAALGTRLTLLLDPARAEHVAAPDNRFVEPLFDRPAVVTLSDTADPDARGFLMATLALLIGERARTLGPSNPVRHVTVLEEAHVVLPEPGQVRADPDAGDAGSAASRLMTAMLAEVRSFGEALIVVDQSPSSVARQVVKNTNLKIAHRILDPEDREILGGAMGLDAEAAGTFASLDLGEAVVASSRILEPVMISVEPPVASERLTRSARKDETPSFGDARPCCGGASPVVHHRAELHGRAAEDVMVHFVAGLAAGATSVSRLRQMAESRLGSLEARFPGVDRGCLAYVGLRRCVASYVLAYSVPPPEATAVLDLLWKAWRAGGGSESIQKHLKAWVSSDVGPHPGCAACDVKCRFRVFSASMGHGGVSEARRLIPLDGMGGYIESLLPWAESARERLDPWLGSEAVGAIRCSVVQALAIEDASWAVTERALGSLSELGNERPESVRDESSS